MTRHVTIIGAGIVPGAMEMMDKLAIDAMQKFVDSGYPLDVESLLVVELDGPEAEVDHLIERVRAIAEAAGSTHLKISETEAERDAAAIQEAEAAAEALELAEERRVIRR